MTSAAKYPFSVGVTLVIANIVGTGVFTSLGYQVDPVPSSFAILLLWAVGGLVSLCGAWCYAELATTMKASGGEYLFLSRIYHPALGFLSGWVSLLVGFAGAVSAVALAIGEYASDVSGLSVQLTALMAIGLVTTIHLFGVQVGGVTQNILTFFKLSLIIFFCVAPYFTNVTLENPMKGASADWSLVFTQGWAVSLVFVVYAYSGWNASAYIAGNLEDPVRNLPRSLIWGTLLVTLVYLMLNGMFLAVANHQELSGQSDVGNVVAYKLFGPQTGRLFSLVFSFALLSTLSAMTIAGPRVGEAMGKDFKLFHFLSKQNHFGMPWPSIVLQGLWAVILVLVSSFKEIIQYIHFGPVAQWEYAEVFAHAFLAIQQVPQFGALVFWIPLPKFIPVGEKAFFCSGLLLVPSGATQGNIIFTILYCFQENWGLQIIPCSVISFFFHQFPVINHFLNGANFQPNP